MIVKGGELLRFIGDAVLAIFPIDDADNSAERAAHAATEAFCKVNTRLDAANAHCASDGDASIAFGAGLHVGEVLYGNFGVPEHFESSVIGAVTNEVPKRMSDQATRQICFGEPCIRRPASGPLALSWPARITGCGRRSGILRLRKGRLANQDMRVSDF